MIAFKRSCCLLLLICSSKVEASSPASDVVTDTVKKVSGVAERKSKMFFANFGSTKNRNKIPGRLDCDYSDPKKSKHCPPVAANPFPPDHPSNVNKKKDTKMDAKSDVVEALTAEVEVSSQVDQSDALKAYTSCLQDPDNPDCRKYHNKKITIKDMMEDPRYHTQPPTAASRGYRTLTGFLEPSDDQPRYV